MEDVLVAKINKTYGGKTTPQTSLKKVLIVKTNDKMIIQWQYFVNAKITFYAD